MLIIDRSSSTVRFILTLSEEGGSSTYTIKFYGQNREYPFGLGANVSPHPRRYDQFEFPTSTFDALPAGQYAYEVYQEGNTKPIERGAMHVHSADEATDNNYVIAPPSEEDDDLYTIEV